jgi:hypothetical protein
MLLDETSLIAHPYRGIRRFAIAGLIILLVLAGIWTTWWLTERHRLQTRLAMLRDRHEAMSIDDLLQPMVPTDQDASQFWKQASQRLPPEVAYTRNALCRLAGPLAPSGRFLPTALPGAAISDQGWLPMPIEWEKAEQREIAKEADSLAYSHKASELPGVNFQWGNTFKVAVDSGTSTLNNVLCDAAIFAHMHGDDAAAIDRVAAAFREADAIEKTFVLPVDQFDLTPYDIRAVTTLQEIAPDLLVDGTPTGDEKAAAPRSAVMKLIANLLDSHGSAIDAFHQTEFVRIQYCSDWEVRRGETIICGPLIDVAQVRVCDYSLARTASIYEPSFPASQAKLQSEKDSMSGSDSQIGNLNTDLFRQYWTAVACRRMLATTLAIRMYQLDHGKRPDRLQDLIPSYLPMVPADPFSTTNAPIGFIVRRKSLPNGNDRPMLFCDVTHPETAPLPDSPTYGQIFQEQYGKIESPLWRDLARWSPP